MINETFVSFNLIGVQNLWTPHLNFLPRLDLKYNKYLTLMLGGKSYINDNERLTMLKLQVIDTFSCNILILQIDNCPSSSRHQSCIILARCLEHWMDGGWCSGCSTDAKQTRGRMQMVKLTYWLSNCSAIMGPALWTVHNRMLLLLTAQINNIPALHLANKQWEGCFDILDTC